MKSESITGSRLEPIPPFARIMKALFLVEESRAVEPVKGLERKSGKRADQPTTLLRKKGDTIEVKVFLPPGGSIDFHL